MCRLLIEKEGVVWDGFWTAPTEQLNTLLDEDFRL